MQTQQNKRKGKSRPKGLDEGAREMVSREVYYCVSSLISELATKPEYADELMEVLQGKPDYKKAALNEGWSGPHKDEFGSQYFKCGGDGATWACATWEELCTAHDIDPYQWEIYEHWIVSDWLADRLEEKGHAVIRDFLGLTIWGRPTTGQAIYCDGVIQSIYSEMMGAN